MSLARFKSPIVQVDVDVAVLDAARAMRDHRVGSVVVTRAGRPIAIVTDRDLVVRVIAAGQHAEDVRLSAFVTYDPVTVHECDGIATAVDQMRAHGVRRLPIVDDGGKAVGIVTADELLAELGGQLEQLREGIENNADVSDTRKLAAREMIDA
jgi:CBS domain-containing protein